MDKKPPVLSRRLSGIDAAFLYLERKEIPLNIAAVGMFDGPIPFREFVANIDSKLDLVPRYRQVAVPPPFNLGYPTWEYDPDFDIKRHIFRVQPEGARRGSRVGGAGLAPAQPGVGPRQAALGDPRRGRLAGRARRADRAHPSRAGGWRRRSGAAADHARSHAGGFPRRHASRERVRRFPRAWSTRWPSRSAAPFKAPWKTWWPPRRACSAWPTGCSAIGGKSALQELATLLPELLQPPERFPFNKPCSGDRKFCWTEVDFSQVQAIRAALGGKVNDCILSVVVRAIARYIRLHGEKVNGRFLRVVCPVNLRGDEQGESLGNRITFLPVVLPLDVRDPVEMLHAVSTRMEIMKSVRAAELIAIGASCLGTTPAPVQELFWRGIPMVPLPLPLLNMICTNVPGSPHAAVHGGTAPARILSACAHRVRTGAGRRGAELRWQALLRSDGRRPRGARRGAVARLHPGLFPGAVQGCRSQDGAARCRNRGAQSGRRRRNRRRLWRLLRQRTQTPSCTVALTLRRRWKRFNAEPVLV